MPGFAFRPEIFREQESSSNTSEFDETWSYSTSIVVYKDQSRQPSPRSEYAHPRPDQGPT